MGYFSSALKKCRKPGRFAIEIVELARLAARTHSPGSLKYPRTFCHALLLCLKEGYQPKEAYGLGLFDPDHPPEFYKKFMSKQKMTKLQKMLNPKSWSYLTEDKSVFYNFCSAFQIPTPKLYGLFFRKTPGWGFGNEILTTRKDWISFFEEKIPEEFAIKPSRGVYGQKITILKKTDKGFLNWATGRHLSAGDVCDLMEKDSKFDRFVIQERMKSHPEIVRLTGNSFLQTVRISTYVNQKDECRILHATLKMILGDNVIDNFYLGRTGNIVTPVEQNRGILRKGKMAGGARGALKSVSIHPKTGVSIEGFQMPLWQECRALVKECVFKFLPIRTIGWDVGITEKGPVIVEGNMWWDPPNQTGRGTVLLDAVMEDSRVRIFPEMKE